MGSDTSQCQHYDGDRKLPSHQPKHELVVLMLLWKQELHFGVGFGRFAIKIDYIFPS